MRWIRAVEYHVNSGRGNKIRVLLHLAETYELQRDSFRSSELDIFLTTLSLGPLELDPEATSHRSSLLVAYVRHLGLHQLPDWEISVKV